MKTDKPPSDPRRHARLVVPLRVLRLTLKKKWFDMIASGEKKEEYRTGGKWILSRLVHRRYDRIEFKNGYGPNVPTMEVEYLGWTWSCGTPEWGATPGVRYVTIRLGRVLSRHNDEHVHHYQRERVSITGLGLQSGKII